MSAGAADDVAELRARNEAIRTEIDRLRSFIDTLQSLVQAIDADYGNDQVMAALSDSLQRALDTMDALCGSLLVLDEDTGELVFVLVAGEVPAERLRWQRIPAGSGIAGWVARHREPVIANDVRRDERFYPTVDETVGFDTESVLAVPVLARGKALGVLEVLNKGHHGMFSEDDQTLLSLMSRFAGELLHRMSERETGRPHTPPHTR